MGVDVDFTIKFFRDSASERDDPVRLAWALSGAVDSLMNLEAAKDRPEVTPEQKGELLEVIFLAHANATVVLEGTPPHSTLNECLSAVTSIAVSACGRPGDRHMFTPELHRDANDLGRVLRNDLHNFVLRWDIAKRRAASLLGPQYNSSNGARHG